VESDAIILKVSGMVCNGIDVRTANLFQLKHCTDYDAPVSVIQCVADNSAFVSHFPWQHHGMSLAA